MSSKRKADARKNLMRAALAIGSLGPAAFFAGCGSEEPQPEPKQSIPVSTPSDDLTTQSTNPCEFGECGNPCNYMDGTTLRHGICGYDNRTNCFSCTKGIIS